MSGASELVERLLAAMEGVTPGPWTARLMERNGVVQDAFVQANDVNGFAYKAEILGDDEYREESGGLTRKLADVRYIALCSPDNIATLLAELDRLSSAHSEAVKIVKSIA